MIYSYREEKVLLRGELPVSNFSPVREYMDYISGGIVCPLGITYAGRRMPTTIPYSPTITAPFPQVFTGVNYNPVGYSADVKYLNTSTWVESSITPYATTDYTALGVLGAPTGSFTVGGIWHHADLNTGWFMTNGASVVFREPVTGVVFSASVGESTTCCVHKGRLYFGGLVDFLPPTYVDKVKSFKTIHTSETLETTRNMVSISSVDLDEVYWRFFPWMFDKDSFVNHTMRGESSIIQMDWPGEVIKLEPLGDMVVVYGTRAISILGVNEGGFPYQRKIANFGLGNAALASAGGHRGRVASSGSEHVFIDSSGELCKVTSAYEVKRLGYYDAALLQSNTIATYSPLTDTYYFASTTADIGFALTPEGFSRTEHRVISIMNMGEEYGVVSPPVTDDFTVTTPVDSFGTTNRKNYSEIKVLTDGSVSPQNLEIKFYTRDSIDTPWQATIWEKVSREGSIFVQKTGIDCQVEVRSTTPGSGFAILDIQVIYEISPERMDNYRGRSLKDG